MRPLATREVDTRINTFIDLYTDPANPKTYNNATAAYFEAFQETNTAAAMYVVQSHYGAIVRRTLEREGVGLPQFTKMALAQFVKNKDKRSADRWFTILMKLTGIENATLLQQYVQNNLYVGDKQRPQTSEDALDGEIGGGELPAYGEEDIASFNADFVAYLKNRHK